MNVRNIKWMALLVVSLCFFTSCTTSDKANPLSGKDTDERVIMCLEITYPEHKFSVVDTFDKSRDCGVYTDENGIEFIVHNLVYDNSKHFGCSDEYLSTILKKMGYIDQSLKIVEKYNQELYYNDSVVSVEITIEDIESGKITMEEIAEMLLEVLNCVDIPKVVVSDNIGSFSTDEVNYYTSPTWGKLGFSFNREDGSYSTGGSISFALKNSSVQDIKQILEEIYQRVIDYDNGK